MLFLKSTLHFQSWACWPRQMKTLAILMKFGQNSPKWPGFSFPWVNKLSSNIFEFRKTNTTRKFSCGSPYYPSLLQKLSSLRSSVNYFCPVMFCHHFGTMWKNGWDLNFCMHLKVEISRAFEFKGYGKLTCVRRWGKFKVNSVLHLVQEQFTWNRRGKRRQLQ